MNVRASITMLPIPASAAGRSYCYRSDETTDSIGTIMLVGVGQSREQSAAT